MAVSADALGELPLEGSQVVGLRAPCVRRRWSSSGLPLAACLLTAAPVSLADSVPRPLLAVANRWSSAPAATVQIHEAFGTPSGGMLVVGRVAKRTPRHEPQADASALERLRESLGLFRHGGGAGGLVFVTVDGQQHQTRTVRGGYFELLIPPDQLPKVGPGQSQMVVPVLARAGPRAGDARAMPVARHSQSPVFAWGRLYPEARDRLTVMDLDDTVVERLAYESCGGAGEGQTALRRYWAELRRRVSDKKRPILHGLLTNACSLRPIDGVVAYTWDRAQHGPVVIVTSSPPALRPRIEALLRARGFPPMHLLFREWGPGRHADSWRDTLHSGRYKVSRISQVLDLFPRHRRVEFAVDGGLDDYEATAEITPRYPDHHFTTHVRLVPGARQPELKRGQRPFSSFEELVPAPRRRGTAGRGRARSVIPARSARSAWANRGRGHRLRTSPPDH